ncbi:hypothetical protein ACWC2T_33630 [Streptomyces sp. NPDC001393]
MCTPPSDTSDSNGESCGTYARSQTAYSDTTLKPVWWTQGTYTRQVMRTDGNLVTYRRLDGAAIWSTHTSGHPGACAVMQSEGQPRRSHERRRPRRGRRAVGHRHEHYRTLTSP